MIFYDYLRSLFFRSKGLAKDDTNWEVRSMGRWNWKEWGADLLFDLAGGCLIAAGVYNFAIHANFPVAGFTGIALILYHLFGIPVGTGILLLNIPVAIFCYRFLGKSFFLKSVKTMIISSLLMDYAAPLFPVYDGNRLLAAICMGVLTGVGYAMIFMRGSSTGGQDFISLSLKKLKPHISIGAITAVLDAGTIVLGTALVFQDVDGLIYSLIATYLMANVMDRIMYGIDEGKMALIVTDYGQKVADLIDLNFDRGATILQGRGAYTGDKRDVVMCACNNKQMYAIKKMVAKADPKAFTIIMESNEVVGEGFKEEKEE